MLPDATVNVAGLKPCASVVPLVVRITVHRPVSGFPDRSTAFTLIDTVLLDDGTVTVNCAEAKSDDPSLAVMV